MSGHLLAKQYDEYMREIAKSRQIRGFEYTNYICVMERITKSVNQERHKIICRLTEDDL